MRIPFQINSVNKSLLGILHISENQQAKKIVLIMCYGLNGNRVEQHRMSVKLGEVCEKKGINLVRFDYTDVGISEGSFENSKLSDRVQNAIDVITFVKGCFNEAIDIYLIGFSDGARIAVNSIERMPDCKGVILWNPIVNIEGQQNVQKTMAKEENRILLDKRTHKPYKPLFGDKLGLVMLRELSTDNSAMLLKKDYKKLFVFGEKDVFTKEIRQYFYDHRDEYPNSDFIIIRNAGHLFSDRKFENEVIAKSTNYAI